jgi:hypothetical protein
MFIVGAFINDTITVAVWTRFSFHVCDATAECPNLMILQHGFVWRIPSSGAAPNGSP